MTTLHTTAIGAGSATSAKTSRLVHAVASIALGLFIVGVVGFSPLEAAHNAAHDTRHSNAFPCH